MSATEKASASATHDAHGDGSGAVPIEKLELAAARAADGLRRALSTDQSAQAQLREVLQPYSVLQAQMGEWQELHHALHQVLIAFSPFYASLRALGQAGTGSTPTDGRTLLRGWRPCQATVDRLADFESRVEHIRLAPQPPGRAGLGWGARIAALRREIEDRLVEETWSIAGLVDLADEFHDACHGYLSLAERELRLAIEQVQRLYTRLLGGL